jgi:hypothetical protein
MSCDTVREHLGAYVDGEVTPALRDQIYSHVADCPGCASELTELHDLAGALSRAEVVAVPPTLWHAIEGRLPSARRGHRILKLRLPRMVGIAAAVFILVGLGLFSLPWGGNGIPQAQAAAVDFGVLLDGLRFDARAAFDKFVSHYEGRRATVPEARQHGKDLTFDLPESLPGGFRLTAVYTLRFGNKLGVAACYERDDQFLGALFHPPVLQEDFGSHEDRECVVGQHRGHAVEVGEWRLVHVTDPSTCHCVLSTLDESTELPPVLSALAPLSATAGSESHGHSEKRP